MAIGETVKRQVTIGKCPKCGGTSGFSTHDYFAGWAECLSRWDCEDSEYPGFNDTVITRKLSKTAVCLDCNRRVERPSLRGENYEQNTN